MTAPRHLTSLSTLTTQLQADTLDLARRNLIRDLAGAPHHVPVVVVDGSAAPACRGESYYWQTHCSARGTCTREHKRVYHPSAYGWRCDYVASTLRVEVGRDWTPAVAYVPRELAGLPLAA